MKETPPYTVHHPRWYRTRVSTYWWLHRWSSMRFILREISSVFVASYVVITLMQIRALARGPAAYAGFQEWLARPPLIALNVVSLFFVLFHTITWFNVAPRAVAMRVRGRRIPDLVITATNYVAWLAVSSVIAWVILRG